MFRGLWGRVEIRVTDNSSDLLYTTHFQSSREQSIEAYTDGSGSSNSPIVTKPIVDQHPSTSAHSVVHHPSTTNKATLNTAGNSPQQKPDSILKRLRFGTNRSATTAVCTGENAKSEWNGEGLQLLRT